MSTASHAASRTVKLGQDTGAKYVLDRASAESMLRAFAIIEAHMRTAKGVLETSPAWADTSGLKRDVVFYKDQMAKLQADYDRAREAAALTFLDGKPREVLISDWEMLKVLDDTSAALAWKAGDFWVEKGMPRNSSDIQPAYPSAIAGGYTSGADGIGGISTTTAVLAIGGMGLVTLVAVALWPS